MFIKASSSPYLNKVPLQMSISIQRITMVITGRNFKIYDPYHLYPSLIGIEIRILDVSVLD